MVLLVCRAYIDLISIDLEISRGGFAALHHRVLSEQPGGEDADLSTIETVCRAVDIASIWYWKQVSCLQRSAVATCLLRRRGIAADLVIGAQRLPFRAHAWVEVDGRVVNDRPYVSELYAVLDRC
jgi:transglutaminase superfamily protein